MIGSSSNPARAPGGAIGSSGAAGGDGQGDDNALNAPQGNPSGDKGPLKIEVPLEIVIACGPGGLEIHPGGYRFSRRVLKGKDPILVKTLESIVLHRQQVDPYIKPRPSIRFLVSPGGDQAYREARRQTVLSGLDWPVSLQVDETHVLDLAPGEAF
jgi:hypothetical protein